MKNGSRKYYLTVLFFVLIINAFAQRILSDYDSIPVSKPKLTKDFYQLNHPVLNEITVVNSKPKPAADSPKNFWGNLAGGTFTLLTGVGTDSSDTALWMTNNALKANNTEFTWNILLFFPGELRKTRERVKNDDGSSSVEKVEWLEVDWSNTTHGFILEKSDTIGSFTMTTDVQFEMDGLTWLSRLEKESISRNSNPKKYFQYNLTDDFIISGLFYGKSFIIISSGSNNKSIILVENIPVALFQSIPDFIIMGKKNRIEPYILINKTLLDNKEIDIFRLSMLSRLIAKTINENNFSK